jgi:purine-binding chemotaxis protein CheW
LRVRFGLPPAIDPRRAKWILIDVEGRSVGLAVDRVTEVFGTGGSEIKPAPVLGEGDDERGIVGVTTHDKVLTFVLDVTRFDVITRPLSARQLLAAASAEGAG